MGRKKRLLKWFHVSQNGFRGIHCFVRRFRWDYLKYLDRNAQGFPEFLNGTTAKYVTTIFPSTSYPAWTTISTGKEDHLTAVGTDVPPWRNVITKGPQDKLQSVILYIFYWLAGLYPEDHGIIANFFLNRQRKVEFMLTNATSTRKAYWWQNPEPVWTTATRAGRHTATILWSRWDLYV